MATLENRPNVALVVLDFQTGVVAEAHERDAVVANVARLVAMARAAQVPVVWVQHEDDEHLAHGSAAWQIVAELDPADAEAHVRSATPTPSTRRRSSRSWPASARAAGHAGAQTTHAPPPPPPPPPPGPTPPPPPTPPQTHDPPPPGGPPPPPLSSHTHL